MKGVTKLKFKRKKEKLPKNKRNSKNTSKHNFKFGKKLSELRLWQNLKLGQKYGVALFVTIGLFTVSTIITFVLLTIASSKMETVKSAGEQAVEISDAVAAFHQKGSIIGTYIIDQKPLYLEQFGELTKSFDKLKKDIASELSSGSTQDLLAEVDANDKKINEVFLNDIKAAMENGDSYKLRLGKLQVDNIVYQTVQKMEKLSKSLKEEQQSAISSAKSSLVITLVVLVVSIIISALLGIGSILLIGRIISKKLGQIVNVSNEIAAGNLNIESVDYNGNDEIAEISKATNAMKERLQSMIQEISAVSSYVTDKSSELNTAANEVKAASQQVASTMQELSSGAEQQASSATGLARMMETYLKKVNDAAQSGNVINKASKDVLDLTKQGDTLMKESQQQMVKINDIMKGSVEKVQGLDDRTKQISKLVQVIQEIAGQTNLLALNAAIEAARAGEHGRGFAVVADEVRKLAEQVSLSVSDITKIVQGIQSESNEVVSSLQLGYSQVEEGTEQIEITGQTFQNIYSSVNIMTKNVKDISEMLGHISAGTAEMNQSIENIASVSEQSAAGIEQTSASVTQTNHSMEDISDNAHSLSELADQLNSMISKFKL